MGTSFYGFNADLIGNDEAVQNEQRLQEREAQGNNAPEEDDFAVLLGGDSFGEDAILQDPSDEDSEEIFQLASVYAMGGVTCGFLTREVLVNLKVLDLIISALLEANQGIDEAEIERKGMLSDNNQSISSRFLAYEKMAFSDAQAPTAQNGGKQILQVKGSMFKVLRRLHHTELTDVWVALHKASGPAPRHQGASTSPLPTSKDSASTSTRSRRSCLSYPPPL